VQGTANPIRNRYNAVTVQTVETVAIGRRLVMGSGSDDAETYADGPNAAAQPKDSIFEKRRVNAQTVLQLKLAPGGTAIRLVPVR
jgi:hypothetical protein